MQLTLMLQGIKAHCSNLAFCWVSRYHRDVPNVEELMLPYFVDDS